MVLFACSVSADELTRTVQERLKALGAYSGPLDGNASPDFTNALKTYQQRHKLPPTGVLDPATAKALDDETGMALPGSSGAPPSEPAQQSSSPSVPAVPTFAPASPQAAPPEPRTPQPSPAASSPSPTAAPPAPSASLNNSPSPSLESPLPIPTAAAATSPSAPVEPPPQFSTERVTKFLRDYLHAGEGKYVTPQLRFFSFPVDYFAHGLVNQQFVRSDTLRYVRRWPRRRYMLTEPVKVAAVDNQTATADFTIAFSVQKGKRRANGRTTNRVTLREVKSQLKIIAIKEQRVAD